TTLVMIPATVMALALAGLPLTGGALAKLTIKPVLGYGLVGALGSASSVATALLMTHFLRGVAALPSPMSSRTVRGSLCSAWLVIAAASVAIPWALYATVMGGSFGEAMSPSALWSSFWPVMLGVALCLALPRWSGIHFGGLEQEPILSVSARVTRVALCAG